MQYIITLEYKGTNYAGWQSNKANKTIENELSYACQKACGADNRINIQAACHTGEKVHALNQIILLDTSEAIDVQQFKYAVNRNLPKDINVLFVDEIKEKFNPYKDAFAFSYTYQIAKRRSAFSDNTAWYFPKFLDADLMQEAIIKLEGEHDFSNFAENKKLPKNNLINANVFDADELWVIRLVASKSPEPIMLNIVGLCIEIGLKKEKVSSLKKYLEDTNVISKKIQTPPTHGLFLENIYYDEEEISYDLDRIIW